MSADNPKNTYLAEDLGDSIPTAGSTSSVGPIGEIPQKLPHFNRYKTFNNVPQDYVAFTAWYQKIQNFPLKDGERVTVRSVVKKADLAKFLSELPGEQTEHGVKKIRNSLIEGIIDLAGCGIAELEDYAIVYLAKNHESRPGNSVEVLEERIERATQIFQETKPAIKTLEELQQTLPNAQHLLMQNGNFDLQNIPEKAKEKFLSLDLNEDQIANAIKQEIKEQYAKLLEIFGWKDESIQSLIKDNTIDIIINFDETGNVEVLGSGIAELAVVNINGTEFKMFELTEALVNRKYLKLGVYRVICSGQVVRCFEQQGAILVYGESNLHPKSAGVLYAAARNGRQPGNIFEYLDENGNVQQFYILGALHKHVPVGDEDNGDFLPTAMTRGRYKSLTGEA